MHECPNCGFEIEDTEVEICPKCNFDFNDTISCPYKISRRCVHTRRECNIRGLNHESCRLYLQKSGIIPSK